MMHRRLARDYETLPGSTEAVIHIASIDSLAKRITDEATPTNLARNLLVNKRQFAYIKRPLRRSHRCSA
jgi:hypothetical protein